MEMRHFVFKDYDSGEEFIVGEFNIDRAYEEAEKYFSSPRYIGEFTEEEAEMSGLDEY